MLRSTRSTVTMSAGVTRRDAAALAALVAAGGPAISSAEDYAYQPALKGKDYGKSQMGSSDFTKTPSGLSYKDGSIGNAVSSSRTAAANAASSSSDPNSWHLRPGLRASVAY